MLSNSDWHRLIRGLISATSAGRLQWVEDDPPKSLGTLGAVKIAAILGTQIDRLRAVNGAAVYEVSAAVGGIAPFGLRVWESNDSGQVLVGLIHSSTALPAMSDVGINAQLQALYAAARGTIEEGAQIVDRLLSALDELPS